MNEAFQVFMNDCSTTFFWKKSTGDKKSTWNFVFHRVTTLFEQVQRSLGRKQIIGEGERERENRFEWRISLRNFMGNKSQPCSTFNELDLWYFSHGIGTIISTINVHVLDQLLCTELEDSVLCCTGTTYKLVATSAQPERMEFFYFYTYFFNIFRK
jgi:hypothetical protein